jgi:glutamate N-acetyltransferase/amino-acid N-acetyltransferase
VTTSPDESSVVSRVGVTAPQGFVAAGVSAGFKASGKLDLGLLVSEVPASAGGLFTTNAFAAAPVVLTRKRLVTGKARAVVVNSGQANAGTGQEGLDDAEAMAATTAVALGLAPSEVLVCSTGVIGPRIHLHKVASGVAAGAKQLSPGGGRAFATAIRTTDSVTKEAAVEAGGFVLGGCAKGAGMIAPDLATLLVFLSTDATAGPWTVQQALLAGAAPVWNSVTVDGCSSTNDTVLLMANGASGVDASLPALTEAVHVVCEDLARQVVADAEGAQTSLVVQVDGAESDQYARRVGRAVAGSMLVKTAVFGKDPNPGRILQAIGASGVPFDPDAVSSTLGGVRVIEAGRIPAGFDPDACAQAMKEREVVIRIELGRGPGSATAFGCDLGYEYVRINGEYTT